MTLNRRHLSVPLAVYLALLAHPTIAFSADTAIRVPEPDTLALVFAAVAAGVLVWRIRRKK